MPDLQIPWSITGQLLLQKYAIDYTFDWRPHILPNIIPTLIYMPFMHLEYICYIIFLAFIKLNNLQWKYYIVGTSCFGHKWEILILIEIMSACQI